MQKQSQGGSVEMTASPTPQAPWKRPPLLAVGVIWASVPRHCPKWVQQWGGGVTCTACGGSGSTYCTAPPLARLLCNWE